MGCPVLLDVLFTRGSAAGAPQQSAVDGSCKQEQQQQQQQQGQPDRRILHVQSISSWAPSCIGPYSQVSWVQARSARCAVISSNQILGMSAALPIARTSWAFAVCACSRTHKHCVCPSYRLPVATGWCTWLVRFPWTLPP